MSFYTFRLHSTSFLSTLHLQRKLLLQYTYVPKVERKCIKVFRITFLITGHWQSREQKPCRAGDDNPRSTQFQLQLVQLLTGQVGDTLHIILRERWVPASSNAQEYCPEQIQHITRALKCNDKLFLKRA